MELSIITVVSDDHLGLCDTVSSLWPWFETRGAKDWEWVVIDGSRNPDWSRFAYLQKMGWPVRWISENRKGIYAAMNDGIRSSFGEVLWFLNAGDCLKSPDILNSILKRFKSHVEWKFVCGVAELEDGDEFLFKQPPRESFSTTITNGRNICHQAVLFRRELFQQLGGYDQNIKVAADYEFFIRMYENQIHGICLPDVLVRFDVNGKSRHDTQLPMEIWRLSQRSSQWRLNVLQRVKYRTAIFFWIARWKLFRILRKIPFALMFRPIWNQWRRATLRYE